MKDETSGYVGYVLRFRVPSEVLQRDPLRRVGAAVHEEYWIPAGELDDFNDHIDGVNRVDRLLSPLNRSATRRHLLL